MRAKSLFHAAGAQPGTFSADSCLKAHMRRLELLLDSMPDGGRAMLVRIFNTAVPGLGTALTEPDRDKRMAKIGRALESSHASARSLSRPFPNSIPSWRTGSPDHPITAIRAGFGLRVDAERRPIDRGGKIKAEAEADACSAA